jgi:glycosyltransferase involved in cell wall biosynthesis
MNITLLTTGHDPYDDRIFYHLARSFSENGWNVEIVSSRLDLKEIHTRISLNCFAGNDFSKKEKIIRFIARLMDFKPDVIICSEPLTILAAKQYTRRENSKVRIVYDITEWYPSKKNLEIHKIPFRWFFFVKLLIFNSFVSYFADAFIFGEWYKARPYRFLFPWKPFVYISYYPDLKYINYSVPRLSENKLRLNFSGRISLDKGFGNFINVLKEFSKSEKDYNVDVKIIGWYETYKDQEECSNLIKSLDQNITLSFFSRRPLFEYLELINDTDIFIDLRTNDLENRHCLPIRMFYYAALGRPVVFTALKAIKREVEISKFGYLVQPDNTKKVVEIILMYIKNQEFYYNHCSEAKRLSESMYNWKRIEPLLINFINEISSS